MNVTSLHLAAVTVYALCLSVRGQVAEDYFNDYGTGEVNVSGLGSAGGGWAGSWSTNVNHSYYRYTPGTALTYSGSGYSAPSNQTGAEDGTVDGISGASGSYIVFREFDADPDTAGNQGLTGTIWLSCLGRVTINGRDIFMFLGNAKGNVTAVALRGSVGTSAGNTAKVPEAGVKYAYTWNNGSDATFAAANAHLLLVKVAMNCSGTSDSLDFWVDPTLGADGPTSPALYSLTGADACGATFISVGFATSSLGGTFDALRVSNAANGYRLVTGIPEPAPTRTLILVR